MTRPRPLPHLAEALAGVASGAAVAARRRRCACCGAPSNRCPCAVCGACSTSGGDPSGACTCGQTPAAEQAEQAEAAAAPDAPRCRDCAARLVVVPDGFGEAFSCPRCDAETAGAS